MSASPAGASAVNPSGRFHELLRGLAEEHDRQVSSLRSRLGHVQSLLVSGEKKPKSKPGNAEEGSCSFDLSTFCSDRQRFASGSNHGNAPRRGVKKEAHNLADTSDHSRTARTASPELNRPVRAPKRIASPGRADTLPGELPGIVERNTGKTNSLPPIRNLCREKPPSPEAPPPQLPHFSGTETEREKQLDSAHAAGSLAIIAERKANSLLLQPSDAADDVSTHSNPEIIQEKAAAPRLSQDSHLDLEDDELWTSPSSPDGMSTITPVKPESEASNVKKKNSLLSSGFHGSLNFSKLKALVPGANRGSADSQTESKILGERRFLSALSPRTSITQKNRVSFHAAVQKVTAVLETVEKSVPAAPMPVSSTPMTFVHSDATWSRLELDPVWKQEFRDSAIGANAYDSIQSVPLSRPRMRRSGTTGLRRNGWVNEVDGEEEGCSTKMLIASPSSTHRLVWEICGFCFLIYDMVMIPLQVYEPEETPIIYAIGMCCTCFWTLDMLATFLVGYHTRGMIEMRLKWIAFRYLKSWFLLDASIVGMDWAFFIISRSKGSAGVLRLTKLSRGFRVLRLLRIAKFHVILSDMIQRIHSEYKRTMIGILKIVFFIIIVNHFIACGFYGLKFLRDEATRDKYWVYVNFDDTDGLGYRYWTSMHWSLTQFTPASMEVVPKNSLERFYTVSVMFVALITFSSFISSITNAMTRLRQINSSQMEQEGILHKFLGQNNISRPLVARILHLIQDRQGANASKARTKEEDVLLFKKLPDSLKNEVRLETFGPVLVMHPLFFEYSYIEVHGMRRLCRSAISEKALIYHEELYGAGKGVTHMVFIREGSLSHGSVVDGELQTHHAGSGSWVCEAALWAIVKELPFPFTAMTTCEILMLNAREFGDIVRKYPMSARFVATYARIFMEHISHECNDCAWKALGWHDVDLVRTMVHDASNETLWEENFVQGGGKKSKRHSIGGGLFDGLTKEITHISNLIIKKSKTGTF